MAGLADLTNLHMLIFRKSETLTLSLCVAGSIPGLLLSTRRPPPLLHLGRTCVTHGRTVRSALTGLATSGTRANPVLIGATGRHMCRMFPYGVRIPVFRYYYVFVATRFPWGGPKLRSSCRVEPVTDYFGRVPQLRMGPPHPNSA